MQVQDFPEGKDCFVHYCYGNVLNLSMCCTDLSCVSPMADTSSACWKCKNGEESKWNFFFFFLVGSK